MNKFNLAILALFPIAAFLLVYLSTLHYNLGVSPDSVFYIQGANNIKLNLKYVTDDGKLINHWPPFYSILLASFSSLFNKDSFQVGPLFNSVFCSVFFLIFTLILFKRGANRFTVLILNLFLLSSVSLVVFSGYNSEVPFLLMLVVIIYLVINFDGNTVGILTYCLVGLLCGLLVVTRYAALPFSFAILVYLIMISYSKTKQMYFRYALLFLLFFIPLLLWHLYTNSFHEALTSRKLSYHPISKHHIKEFFATIRFCIFPHISISGMLLICALSIGGIWYYKEIYFRLLRFGSEISYFSRFLIAVIFLYLLFLVLSISFFDYATPLDSRILSPLYVILLVLVAPVLDYFGSIRYWPFKFCFYLLLLFLLIGNIRVSRYMWNVVRESGTGYTSASYKDSELIKDLLVLKNVAIFSNKEYALQFLAPASRLLVRSLPTKYHALDGMVNSNYRDGLQKICYSVLNRSGVIAYFYDSPGNFWPSEAEIRDCVKGSAKFKFYSDGFIVEMEP